ncbi:serine/threonine protein kinase [Nitzschia inconspicua]|uniref:Serine/threonine protein kinase n=1 Tax=Nitzschia inconspicua TaxID=303405 RepID=A0A9K3PYQ3_9STRA|nr:serine/threonine protein kinase [Nitzschia inconspicua]
MEKDRSDENDSTSSSHRRNSSRRRQQRRKRTSDVNLQDHDRHRTKSRRKSRKRSPSFSSSTSSKKRRKKSRRNTQEWRGYNSHEDSVERQRRSTSSRSPSRRKSLDQSESKKDNNLGDRHEDYDHKRKRKGTSHRSPHRYRRRDRDDTPPPRKRRDGENRRHRRREEDDERRHSRRHGRRSRRSSSSLSRDRHHRRLRKRYDRQRYERRRSYSWSEERRQFRDARYNRERHYQQRRREENRQRLDPPLHGLRTGVVSDDEDFRDTVSAMGEVPLTGNVATGGQDREKKRRQTSATNYDDATGHYKGRKGSVIADRYRIIKEVGVGTFGRVLECIDLTHHSQNNQHRLQQREDDYRDGSRKLCQDVVAIKVVRNVKRYHESAIIEADIIRDINRRGGRGLSHCAVMYDAFSFQGHFCMVFEVLGPSLYDYLKHRQYKPFPASCVRHFAQQLLETLEFLHSFKIIHTDLKLENLLLLNDREVSYRGNEMIPESTRIKVIDFGGATYDNEKKSSIVNTRQYRAPEVILGCGWSMPSDLWSLGCILAELYKGELLYPTHDNMEHLALIEKVIGPFPRRMLKRAKNVDVVKEAFDSKGRHRMNRVLSPESFEYVNQAVSLESMVNGDDVWLSRLLRKVLVIDPNDRASAHECLKKFY